MEEGFDVVKRQVVPVALYGASPSTFLESTSIVFGDFADVGDDHSEEFISFAVFAFPGFKKSLQNFCFFCSSEHSELLDDCIYCLHYCVICTKSSGKVSHLKCPLSSKVKNSA